MTISREERGDTATTKLKCKHCGTEIAQDVLMQKQGHCNTCMVCGEFYSDTIQCDDCGTVFQTKMLYDKNGCTECLVCGKKFNLGLKPKTDDLLTWYLYSDTVVTTALYDFDTPIATIKAKNLEEAEEKFSHTNPDKAQSPNARPMQTKCPNCGSTDIQLVPRKWSLFAGIATNKVDRICTNCMHKF